MQDLVINVADISDQERNRRNLETLSYYLRALRGGIEECKRKGQNWMAQSNSLEKWQELFEALEASERAMALVTVGGAKPI